MTNKLPIKEVAKAIPAGKHTLVVGLGFDARSLEVVKIFPKEKLSSVVGVSNAGWNDKSEQNIVSFKSIVGESARVLGYQAKKVMTVADEFSSFVSNVFLEKDSFLFIDITAMSHELIAVLLGILDIKKLLPQTKLLYLGAANYSHNTSEEDIWLSRGVRGIRSVLGFLGEMLPSRKLHLVLMAGFEVERAAEVIACYEPALLSIGVGGKTQSVSEEHYTNNKRFFEKLNEYVTTQTMNDQVRKFEFSCVDPGQTRQDLLKHIDEVSKDGEYNIVICPLNTKISAVGAVFAALERQSIQICYAEPMEYNTDGYASSGDMLTIIDLSATPNS